MFVDPVGLYQLTRWSYSIDQCATLMAHDLIIEVVVVKAGMILFSFPSNVIVVIVLFS